MVKLLLQSINEKLAMGREIDNFANLYGKVTVIEYATKEKLWEIENFAHLDGKATAIVYYQETSYGKRNG